MTYPVCYVRNKSIFDSSSHAVVCPVNTVGVMGNGLALAFKNRYPALFIQYKAACDSGLFKDKKAILFSVGEKKIVCLRTKEDWKHSSTEEYIRTGLMALKEIMETEGFLSVALPPIGCGKGGLERTVVYPMIEALMPDDNYQTFVYDYP